MSDAITDCGHLWETYEHGTQKTEELSNAWL